MGFAYLYRDSCENFRFYRIPKLLMTDRRFASLSNTAKIAYGLLLDRAALSVRSGWIDELGRVYVIYTISDMMQDLGCTNKTVIKVYRELENLNLIERCRKGQGQPAKIYVKDFSRYIEENASCSNLAEQNNSQITGNTETCKNYTSGHVKSTHPGVYNFPSNDTDISDTDLRDTDLSSYKKKDEYREYLDYFMRSLEAENLMHDCPSDQDRIMEMVKLLAETCATHSAFIRIGREEKSADLVRSVLMKLTREHILFVLYRLDHPPSEIGSMRQYMLTCLYNAQFTMANYYSSEVGRKEG